MLKETNSTGDAFCDTNYVPFGPDQDESDSEAFKYTGKRRDATELYYFGARYYDPETGRFITEYTFHGARERGRGWWMSGVRNTPGLSISS